MGAKTCYPGAQVTIFRTEQQAQADNLPQELDITPYIGEGGSIRTAKDLYNPKGRWEVVIPDKPWGKNAVSGGGQSSFIVDSIYGLIAPMNVVEIRLARDAYKYTNRLPVIMRGFVRDVAREETMSPDGQPTRFVRLSGDDYGCIGEIVKLHQWYGSIGQYLNPILRLNELAIKNAVLPASQYIETLLEELWNRQLFNMMAETGNGHVEQVQYDGQVEVGAVYTAQIATNNGTAWKLMMDQADTPWNELYIEDRDIELDDGDHGPFLVYRPTPYAEISQNLDPNLDNNQFIENTGQKIDPQKVRIVWADDGEKVGAGEFVMMRSASYRRHDREVYNIFWVTGQALKYAADKQMAVAIANEVVDVHSLHHENSQVEIYGARPLEVNSSQVPDTSTPPHHVADEPEAARVSISEWTKKRRQWLMAANRDNVKFDEGELVVHGNEQLRIGSYYLVLRGSFKVQHYITQVSHHFVPYREFTTTLGFIRANNHWLREQWRSMGQSPYFMEGRQGVLEE